MKKEYTGADGQPGFISAWASKNSEIGAGQQKIMAIQEGKRIDLEFSLAPLTRDDGPAIRFLGLCQTMTPEEVLNGRPINRLQALAVYPPAPDREAAIRLVSSR
jgi:hypothetical protein